MPPRTHPFAAHDAARAARGPTGPTGQGWRTAAAAAAALALLLALPGPAPGQDRLFPGETLMPRLDADPLAPVSRGSFVLADRPDSDFPGRNVEAEVALGHALPVLRLQPEDPGQPALGLEFRVGVFSRFFMETPQRDLIGVDYRVDVPFTVRYRAWEGRLGYQHFSAHLADDYIARFGREGTVTLRQHSRDGLEAVVARRLRRTGLRLYLGGRLNFHANPGVHESAAKAGLEWDPGRTKEASSGAWPFLAGDFEVRDETDGVAGTGVGGVRVRLHGQEFRLEARGHVGPSPLGKLADVDESFVGLGLRIDF